MWAPKAITACVLFHLLTSAMGWITSGKAFGSSTSIGRTTARRQESTLLVQEKPSTVKLAPVTPVPANEKTGLASKLYFPTFLPPWFARDTVQTQLSQDIWSFEQRQTFVNVSVNIRSTVIRLDKGELFVHAPVAPTKEYVTMLKELGNVKYIVLPVTAVEHKVYMAKFVKQFPQAKVYVAPGQFSWPIDLPLGFKVDGILTEENKKDVPFAKEIDYTGWFYRPFTGSISEVAFFHKKSKTLLVTDAVIYIDEEPPEVLKRQGVKPSLWKKMALQACFLGPPNLDTFDELKKKLLVSPVIRILVISRAKKEVAAWIKQVCQWKFERIIPAHFSAPIKATPKDLKEAYAFLEDDLPVDEGRASFPTFDFSSFLSASGKKGGASRKSRESVTLPEKDTAILKALDKFVSATGLAE